MNNNNRQNHGEGIHWCGGGRPNSRRPSSLPGSAPAMLYLPGISLLERLLWRTVMDNIIMYISHNDI